MTVREKLKRLEPSPEQHAQVQSIMELQEQLKHLDLAQLTGQAEGMAEIFAKAYSEAIAREILPASTALSALTEEARTIGSKLHQTLNRANTELPQLIEQIRSQDQPLQRLEARQGRLQTLGITLGALLTLNLCGIMYLILRV